MTAVTPVDIAPKHSHSDERCEPKEHGQELNTSDGELVSSTREACRREGQICDREESPDRSEQHKVHAVRRPASPWVGVRINNYR